MRYGRQGYCVSAPKPCRRLPVVYSTRSHTTTTSTSTHSARFLLRHYATKVGKLCRVSTRGSADSTLPRRPTVEAAPLQVIRFGNAKPMLPDYTSYWDSSSFAAESNETRRETMPRLATPSTRAVECRDWHSVLGPPTRAQRTWISCSHPSVFV